jgi:CheY-like chemotaxis protein
MTSVLAVDGDSQTLKLVTYLLSKIGITVMTAGSGIEAIELVPNIQPDLVILELALPDINGLEIVQTIRVDPILKQTPIIALASAEYFRPEEILQAGCDAFIQKPIDTRTFPSTIKTLLEGKSNS